MEQSKSTSRVSEDVSSGLSKAYGLNEVEAANYNLPKIDIEGSSYSPEEATVYAGNNNNLILLFQDHKDSNVMFSVKGEYTSNTFTEIGRFKEVGALDAKGDGNISITNLKDNLGFVQNFAGGHPLTPSTPANTTMGFCQREGSETFNHCFNREVNEFCDDWISTIAYITHYIQISALIATMCSC